MSPANPREALAREALRLHERYHRELIERFCVCPWAKPARAAGRTRAHVVVDASCSPEELAPVLAEWAAEDTVDVAFVIAPRFTGDADAFADWATSIAQAHRDAFLTAPFYPRAPGSAGPIQFLRQTPDPTVQLVRRTRLEEIRAQDPPHYTDIFDLDLRKLEADNAPREVAASVVAHNERMIEREGRVEIQRIFDDIREDRERTYARLLPLL
ncbi:MAG: hypothetical protein JRJ10_04125 [Deltaproteobacteria bacterium]|nr:hypothetical protein [Deltaproteobacteria bacterium]